MQCVLIRLKICNCTQPLLLINPSRSNQNSIECHMTLCLSRTQRFNEINKLYKKYNSLLLKITSFR